MTGLHILYTFYLPIQYNFLSRVEYSHLQDLSASVLRRSGKACSGQVVRIRFALRFFFSAETRFKVRIRSALPALEIAK